MSKARPEPDVALEAARLRAILKTARDAIITIDPQGRITLFNDAAQQIFGYRADEVLGRDLALLMPEPYRGQHTSYIEEYRRTGRRRAIGRIRQVEGLRRSGEVFPMELSVAEVCVGGEILYTAVIRDVTERVRTQRELDESRRVLLTLVSNLPGAAYRARLDSQWTLELVSDKIEELTGFPATAFMNGEVGYAAVLHPADRDRVVGEIGRAVDERRPYELEYRIRTTGGETKWVWEKGQVVGGPEHPLEAREGFLTDISARKRDEAELERLRRLSLQRQRLADIGALTAKIVHDLANPLAALSMVSQGILRRVERSPRAPVESVRSQAERLLATAGRLDALLGEFKDFARVQRLDLQDVELGPLLRQMEEFWRPEAARQDVVLDVVIPDEEIRLRADPERLMRVFDNLLRNALDAIGQGPGRVVVSAERVSAEGLRLRFSDTGPGLPAGVDVFALFETTKATGTGLGLPICRQIVAAHGGEISVAAGEGGAAFEIELPLHGPPIA